MMVNICFLMEKTWWFILGSHSGHCFAVGNGTKDLSGRTQRTLAHWKLELLLLPGVLVHQWGVLLEIQTTQNGRCGKLAYSPELGHWPESPGEFPKQGAEKSDCV